MGSRVEGYLPKGQRDAAREIIASQHRIEILLEAILAALGGTPESTSGQDLPGSPPSGYLPRRRVCDRE